MKAIGKALQRIKKYQGKKGDFKSLSTFHVSLILGLLGTLKGSHFEEDRYFKWIIAKGIDFLLQEKGKDSTWNYWQKGIDKNVPPDLDDTAAALIALSLHKSEKVNGEILSDFVKNLLLAEEKEGGPYSTWIVPISLKEKWKDIDGVVNSQIAFFLSLHNINLPNVQQLLEQVIENPLSFSKYYVSEVVVLYFIAKAYTGKSKDKIIGRLLQLQKGLWKNDLELALSVSTLIRLGFPRDKLSIQIRKIEKICSSSTIEDSSLYPLYVEEIKEGKPVYSSSPALLLAFSIEALALYFEFENREKKEKKKQVFPAFQYTLSHIVSEIKFLLSSSSLLIYTKAAPLIDLLIVHDPEKEISLLSFYFYHSLKAKEKKKKKVTKETLVSLGVANVLGWLAYRIYDDVLDGEAVPELIPIANVSLRNVTSLYSTLLSAKEEKEIFKTILNSVDAANSWEREHCFREDFSVIFSNLPEYGSHQVLAEKSLGHALGPLIILMKHGFSAKSQYIKSLLSFFTHYLIARQMNDDAHDYLSDLKRGFINSASNKVLRIYGARHPKEKGITQLTEEVLRELQEIFWHTALTHISEEIFIHTKKANQSLEKLQSIMDTTYLASLLLPAQSAAQKAVEERDTTLEFLGAY